MKAGLIHCYYLFETFPQDLKYYQNTNNGEQTLFCLVNQMRRAAASITANIAEGYAKISSKDKLRFYNISQGSLEETRNFIILSKDLGYITLQDKEQLGIQAAEISRLLNAYCIALLKNVSPPTT